MPAWIKNLGLVVASVVTFLLLAEVILNVLPVRSAYMIQPVTFTERVPRFKPNRDISWSKLWNFSLTNRRHVNNFGFVDDQDYDPDSKEPLLTIIGDSYVESLMVPFDKSIQGRLASNVAPRTRVYSFALSGSQLPTYLVFAGFARDVFHHSAAVIVIISNDFDESWLEFGRQPNRRLPKYTYFTEDESGSVVMETIPYRPSTAKRILRRSALARYLLFNLEIGRVGERIMDLLRGEKSPVYVANTVAAASSKRLQASRRAVDEFLARLPQVAGLKSEKILFVVDGNRSQIYGDISNETAEASFFNRMRRYFIAVASARGYEVIDMHPLFREHFRQHGQRFEFPIDNHWNSLGHSVAAAAVHRSRVFSTLNEQAK